MVHGPPTLQHSTCRRFGVELIAQKAESQSTVEGCAFTSPKDADSIALIDFRESVQI